VALIFLVVLVGRIVAQGYTTFETHTLSVPVYLNPERIDARTSRASTTTTSSPRR
jgi:phosphate transport system permease protein